MDFWSDPEFSFLESPPQLIMSVGKCKVSRRDWVSKLVTHGIDYRPDFERIVKFVGDAK
jgi:hypothetical protein